MHHHAYPFIFLFCFLTITAQAQLPQFVDQSPAFVAERLLVHTDRQLYISGEIIWFKVFAFDAGTDQLSGFSRVAYLELIHPDGTPVSRVKVGLSDGQGNGTIELPSSLSSGSYQLRAYTQGMRNGSTEDFCRLQLIVLNPRQAVVRADEERPETFEAFIPHIQAMSVAPERKLDIQLHSSQTEFGQRSLVTLDINTQDENGQPVAADLSLSVALRSAGIASETIFSANTAGGPSSSTTAADNPEIKPEDRGMLLNGIVINEITQAGAPGVEVYLAFPGETALVYLDVTDETGEFSFLLPKLYGLRQIVLQTRTEEELPLRIELTDEFHEIPAATPAPFVLPPAWVPLANASLVNAQVGQAYRSFELPPAFHTADPFNGVPFFGSASARYALDDFTRFPLPEFFFEIVLEVMVRGKYGDERLEVVNGWDNPLKDPDPLLLVDGVPVFDQRTFLKINNKLIEAAEVVTEPFWLNPRFFNGIIQLSSFDKDGRCFRLPANALQRSFLTLLPEREFAAPDHVDGATDRLPDFRNTLYWNPSIQTDEDGKASISFFTSDAIGDFELRAEGVSSQGQLGSATGWIRVGKEVK